MKKICILCLCLVLVGCKFSPFSPDSHQQIDNKNGEIDEIKNNTQGIMAEIGKLKQDNEIHDSQLKDLQQGLFNLKLSSNENSGVQVLQGDGALILVFSIFVVGMILIYFYKDAERYKKMSQILAQQIKESDSQDLHQNIIKAASFTTVEKDVYNLLYKED